MSKDYVQQQDPISRSISVVDQSLRDVFPENYWKRCMYAAFGLRELLKEEGIASEIIAGDVACFVLYTQDNQPGMDGFKTETPGVPAHFWVETVNVLIDLGPYYLPRDTRRHSLRITASKGDQWARSALKFDSWVNPSKLPF